jgi:hypothetical protein
MNISKFIIILLLVLVIILFTYKLKNKEHLTTSNEAIQSITSMYKKIYAENNTEAIQSITSMYKKIYAENNTIDSINTNKLCISNKCLTSDGLNSYLLMNSPLTSYMYLPNSSSTINDQNLIWKDISNNMKFSDTVRPNAPIKVVGEDTWRRYYDVSGNVDWNGYANAPWNDMNIYTTTGFETGPQTNGTGIEVTVPAHPIPGKDYSVLWIKVANDRYNYFKVYDMSGTSIRKYYGKQSFGYTSINNISPDGSTNSEHYLAGLWWPFPIDLSGNSSRKIMISSYYKNGTSITFIAGMAFSTNPWNHCIIHGNSLYDQVNNDNDSNTVSQTPTLITRNNNGNPWNNTVIIALVSGSQPIIRIPFVNSGRNKIFYIIEQNIEITPSMNGVEINTTPNSTTPTWQYIGNLNTTFSNPFATHSNSKMYQRYYGVVIPKEYLPVKGSSINDNFMQLRFTIPIGTYFRFGEVGTHDVNPFE